MDNLNANSSLPDFALDTTIAWGNAWGLLQDRVTGADGGSARSRQRVQDRGKETGGMIPKPIWEYPLTSLCEVSNVE